MTFTTVTTKHRLSARAKRAVLARKWPNGMAYSAVIGKSRRVSHRPFQRGRQQRYIGNRSCSAASTDFLQTELVLTKHGVETSTLIYVPNGTRLFTTTKKTHQGVEVRVSWETEEASRDARLALDRWLVAAEFVPR